MYTDLTKDAPEPDEPTAATLPLQELPTTDGPTTVEAEKEPPRLTAREELTLPVKAFGAAIATGSPVLTGMILRGLWNAARDASRTANTTAPAKVKAKPGKDDQPAVDSDQGEGEQGDKAPPKKEAAPVSGIGDMVERLVMGAFVIGATCAAGGGVLAILWSFLAPYVGWLVLALIVGWCLAAVHVAPELNDDEDQENEATPINDHENVAGEQPTEDAPEVDPARDWPRRRSAIRQFVEGAVAAGAAGFREEKGRGASVDSLLAELQQKKPLPGWDRKRMIELLELADIPVRDQVSFYVLEEVNGREKKVKKNVPGVHVDDLAKELGKTPALPPQFVADITPGQPPHLAAVPPLVEAPVEAAGEGRSGVA